jgi:uncharacterized protein HemX
VSVLGYYFGWPDGAVWSNLVASAICVGVVYFRVRARMVAQHAEVLAQAHRHHAEHLAQAEQHHAAMMNQAERQQDELLAKADGLHADMRAHVTSIGSHVLTAAVDVPQKLLDDIAKSPKAGAK